MTKVFNKLIAVDALTLDIYPQETLGLVGESGCGKSTLGKMLVRLEKPTDGQILFQGEPLSQKAVTEKIQIIFQDPYSSLNPRMTLGDIVIEPLLIKKKLLKGTRKEAEQRLLKLVGLDVELASRYPHEISGGQRQRVGIARALALSPTLLVCDEPLSALDVSIQAQIVNLLKEFQETLGLTILFISHDLSMVKYLCHRIAVMYLGSLVEIAPKEGLYAAPLHPYTEALLASIFIPDPKRREEISPPAIEGDPRMSVRNPQGCPFAPRCPKAMAHCRTSRPRLRAIKPDHFAACHLYN